VGYPFEKKGWKVYDLDTGNIFVNVYIYPFAPNSEAKSQVVHDNSAVWDNFSDLDGFNPSHSVPAAVGVETQNHESTGPETSEPLEA